MNNNAGTSSLTREYLTVLLEHRSIVALCCCVLTLMLSFYGIIAGVIKTITILEEDGFVSFIYFTMLSNTFAAISMAFIFPYTVEGIRKKRFTLPKWVTVIHYMATTSIAIMFIFVLAFMSWSSPENAFGGPNLVTHIFCPILILTSFFQMEHGYIYSWKERLLGILPFFIYLVVYTIETTVIGETRGGWPDIYQIKAHLSPALAIPVLLLFAFCISTAISLFSNFLTKKRKKKMFRYWNENLDPVEVKIEAYAMGRMAGQYGEKNNIQIPYDILMDLAARYHVETEDLMKAFVKGFLTEFKERKLFSN